MGKREDRVLFEVAGGEPNRHRLFVSPPLPRDEGKEGSNAIAKDNDNDDILRYGVVSIKVVQESLVDQRFGQ